MIKKQQNLKKNSSPNVNEYTMIKNNAETDETETLTSPSEDKRRNQESITSTNYDNDEITNIQNEVINLEIEDDEEDKEENIEELKASIENVSNELI